MRFLLHDFGLFGPAHAIGPNRWPHFDLLWFHSGRVTLRLAGGPAEELRAGDGVLIFPDTDFAGHALTPTAFASVQHFALERGERLPPPLDALRTQRRGHRIYRGFAGTAVIGDIERAIALAGKPASPGGDQVRVLQLALILQQLANGPTAMGRPSGGHGLIADWRRACRQSPLAQGTTAELSARFGLSEKKLRRTLALHGTSPRRFLLDLRMEHARELLAGSHQPIKAIATATGYADVVAFHRAFQAFHTETPAGYRRRLRARFTG
ncbi:MAG: helix-turn-helix transcriptional regulator [Opitutaceae bacterium]|nr:helix-turn-helix transcriptional regulator [Cephaloticoccus sp.]MCP5529262.1 helix-turn-helix transcriptional regulator [Opitutaceae bacterium]